MRATSYPIGRWTVAVTVLLTASCGGTTTGPDGDGDTNNPPATAQLNFFEEELVGTWYRFHSFDGSSQYYSFNADRTGCKWEEASGSNSRTHKSSYSNWSVSDAESPGGSGHYRVTIAGSGLTNGLTFDFPDNTLWPTSFTNLVYAPSTSGKACE